MNFGSMDSPGAIKVLSKLAENLEKENVSGYSKTTTPSTDIERKLLWLVRNLVIQNCTEITPAPLGYDDPIPVFSGFIGIHAEAISLLAEFGIVTDLSDNHGRVTSGNVLDEVSTARVLKSGIFAEKKEDLYPHLIHEFLQAMDDIGAYGEEKYKFQSFQQRRLRGDKSRGTANRCSTSEIGEHVREHYRQYMARVPHDHFKTRKHQLAAAAFNCLMEFYFAGLSDEEPEK